MPPIQPAGQSTVDHCTSRPVVEAPYPDAVEKDYWPRRLSNLEKELIG